MATKYRLWKMFGPMLILGIIHGSISRTALCVGADGALVWSEVCWHLLAAG